jgi:O-antigen/teichoic acid export membrane protein
MPYIFHAWTRGKIGFDPALFGLFSLTLLVYSVARPSAAVLQGNNLLRLQLGISVAVSVIAICGIFVLTPTFGIDGAAAALLLAEAVGTMLTVQFGWRWLRANGIAFPWRLFGVALSSIAVATAAISAIVWWVRAMPIIISLSLIVNLIVCVVFFRELPPIAVAKIRGFAQRLL